jgi:ribosomal protein S18 acetylase RimI-like enzyme
MTQDTVPALILLPLKEDAIPQLIDIYRQCEDFLALGPEPRASVEMVQKDFQHSRGVGGCYCGIYLPHDQLIGVFDFIPSGYDGDAKQAYINLLMLVPRYRNQRWGRLAMCRLEHMLAAFHINRVHLDVQVKNPAAQHFWEQVGFVVTEDSVIQSDTTVTNHMERTF